MQQLEITQRTPLFDASGRFIARGYARHMLFDYDNRLLRSSPFSLKEWDFYQISNERYVLQMTIGHVSYVGSVSATLIDLTTGKRFTVGRMQPFVFRGLHMERNPEKPHTLAYERSGLSMRFEVCADHRTLSLHADGADGTAEIDLLLGNCAPEKEKMVIATPFAKPRQFYLNYKESCYTVTGTVRFGSKAIEFDDDAYGLVDWGRGVWPFRQEWYWGNGSTRIGKKPFGFNIGWGFGDTAAATENMFFYDNRAYKLGRVTAAPMGDGYLAAARYRDDDGRFDLICKPLFDNETQLKVLFVNNHCHQVFGRFSGTVQLEDGSALTVPPFVAFVEHAVNRW